VLFDIRDSYSYHFYLPVLGTTGGKRGFLKGGFSLIGFGCGSSFGHLGGASSNILGTLGEPGANSNGISPFDWDVSTAAKPHIPNDPNSREAGAVTGSQVTFGGKTL
jgi:hypothetical protein